MASLLNNTNGVLILAGLILLFFLYKRKKKGNFSSEDKKLSYIKIRAEGAQEEYAKRTSNSKFTPEEREELSWKFLYDISDYVVDHFSEEDQKKIGDLGKQLIKCGARYEHDMKLGMKPEYFKASQEKKPEDDEG